MVVQRVSIAMCTYNGAAHVLEQLESFTAQTRQPDELIVCDDASQDETADILRHFAAQAPFDVRVVVNGGNLGFARNFAKAVESASGDIVFLSDQDDVWHSSKIEAFVKAFEQDGRLGLVMCDASLVDAELSPLGRTWWQARRFGSRARRKLIGVHGFAVVLKDPTSMAAGATMAFDSRYRSLVLPIPDGWTHDAWIATAVSAVARVGLTGRPLNKYRQHAAQVFGASESKNSGAALARARGSSADHFLATVRRYEQLRERLGHCALPPCHREISKLIDGKITHWSRRADMRGCSAIRRVGMIWKELLLGRYHRYSQGLKSLALDVLSMSDARKTRGNTSTKGHTSV